VKNFTSVHDVKDINTIIDKAKGYKAQPRKDINLGANRRMGMLFFNPSLRTRLSTEIAASNLGMETIVFNADKDSWKLEFEDGVMMNGNTVEHIKDAAPVLGSYFDILCIRTFPALINKEEDYRELVINKLIQYAGIPVVSLESATLHPLQSLTDLITISENFTFNRKPKIVMTWAPHIRPIPQCVSNSFAQWVNKWDCADFVIAHPESFDLDEQYTQGATILHNQKEALVDADFVYVKNWSAFKEYGKVLHDAEQWMLTPKHLEVTHQAKVMHCLPVRRNVELSDAVLDSVYCITTQQAANRVWAAQAVLSELLMHN
jgi:N-succinyl-L-ornithine transcarbamylase